MLTEGAGAFTRLVGVLGSRDLSSRRAQPRQNLEPRTRHNWFGPCWPAGTRHRRSLRILGPLGSGGMGHVYKACRLRLGDEVAIKVLQDSADAAQELHERFLRESRAAAQLRHPGSSAILDFGVDAGAPALHGDGAAERPQPADEIALQAPMPPAARRRHHRRSRRRATARPRSRHHPPRSQAGEHRRGTATSPAGCLQGDRLRSGRINSSRDSTRLTDPNLFIGTMAYAAPGADPGEPITFGGRRLRDGRHRLRDAHRRPSLRGRGSGSTLLNQC